MRIYRGLSLKLILNFIVGVALILVAVFFQNCGAVQAPKAIDLSSMAYSHTGLEKNCAECHSNMRPAPSFKTLSKDLNTLNSAFYHAPEFNGDADCVACHSIDSTKTSLSWGDGKFNHRGVDDVALQACVGCHDGNRPSALVGTPSFNHSLSGKGECLACHGQSVINDIYENLDNWKGGEYFPSGLIGSTSLTVSVGVPTFLNATITAISTSAVKAPLLMNHFSPQISAGVGSSCVNCHTGANVGNYSGGTFHKNLATQPTSCLECHAQVLPSAPMPVGFMGQLSATRNPRSGSMNHNAVDWAPDGTGLMRPTNTKIVSNECSTCHKNPGVSFSGAKYHLAIQAAGLAQPSSCISCHANSPVDRMTAPSFIHSDSKYGVAKNDCTSCHSNRIVNGVVTDWKGGIFSHDPRPLTCVLCHAGERPAVLVGTPAFNHTLNGKGDCIGCHGATSTYNTIADWAGGESMPTDLIGSKNITVTVGTPTFSNTTISKVTPVAEILPLQMDHYSKQVPGIDSTMCINCHAGAAAGNFSGGALHPKVAVQPAACIECHVNAEPTGFVGPAGLGRTPPSSEMRHEAVVWSNNAAGVLSPTSTKILTIAECSTCHKTPGVRWSSAKYHSSLTAAGLPQPASCIDCHANTRPVGSFGNPLFNHANSGGLVDCVTCHNTTNFTNLSGWSGGQYPHAGVTSCVACHSAERPKSTTGWVTSGWTAATTTFNFLTHGGATDCYSCHANVKTYVSPANWAVGNYTHPANLTACATCHTAPIGIVGRPTPGFNHNVIGTNDCIGCHSGTPTNYTLLSGWPLGGATPTGLVNDDITKVTSAYWLVNPTKLNFTGTKVTSTTKTLNVKLPMQILHSSNQVSNVTSCSTCHSVLPAVANTGTKYHPHGTPTACVSCHSPGAIPTGIVGPLATAIDKTPNFDHAFKYGAGTGNTLVTAAQDCAVCHTGGTGSNWSTGAFHSKVGANTVASCTACHYVKMPQVLDAVNTSYTTVKGSLLTMHFSHTTTAVTSQECTTCHKQVGPGGATPWATNAAYHKNITTQPTQCLTCHSGDKPANGTGQSTYDHATIGTNDCNTCHTVTAATTLWRPAAAYDHKAPYQNCNACHETKQPFPRPAATTVTRFNILTYTGAKPPSVKNDIYFHSSTYNGGPATDCKVCHANATEMVRPGLVAGLLNKVGVSWQNGYFNHKTSGGSRVGNSTCIKCHDTLDTFYKHSGVGVSKGTTAPCLECH